MWSEFTPGRYNKWEQLRVCVQPQPMGFPICVCQCILHLRRLQLGLEFTIHSTGVFLPEDDFSCRSLFSNLPHR